MLPKLSLGRRQAFPPGRSERIAELCFAQTAPQGRNFDSLCCVDRLRNPPGLAVGQCWVELPELDRGRAFYLNVIPISVAHSLPLVFYLNLISMDHNFVPRIHPAKFMIQRLLVLRWLIEKISSLSIHEEPGLRKVKWTAKVKKPVGESAKLDTKLPPPSGVLPTIQTHFN